SDLQNDTGYITGYTETDPTVPSHVKSITQANITAWNNKSDFSGDYNDLDNKPTIPSVGNSKVYYGVCDTFAGNQEKIVTIDSDYSLVAGNVIRIKFTNENRANSPTLNINNTGAKSIVAKPITGLYLGNTVVEFVYDGTNYVISDYGSATTEHWGITMLSNDINDYDEWTAVTPKAAKTLADTKQDVLVSGTSIKTINNTSLLGSGNITVSTFDGNYNNLTNKPTIPTEMSHNNIVDIIGDLELKDLSYLYAEREDFEINVGNFDTTNTTNMTGMFADCVNLENLFILDFDFTNVTSYSNIFRNCGADNDYPTYVYVKDQAAQDWILNLSSNDRPADWTSDNVLIGGIG
ncbi:MAG: BspA family leucine-rich repeat surface protein, partial [Bacteroidales bacterium]|nr:BspA family leucine-rich repeat surface protein [Bacteroidales bacterium]